MAKKIRASFLIPDELLERVRDAVVALQGPPHRMTMAKFAQIALGDLLRRFEETENKGQPFPPHDGALRTGRPVGRGD